MRTTLACLLVLLAQLHLNAQSAGRVSLDAYVADLERLVSALSNASSSDAETVAATVPLRWRVQGETGEITVDGAWIISELRNAAGSRTDWPSRRNNLAKRLAGMRDLAKGVPGERFDDARKRTRDALEDVLARREFQNARAGWMSQMQQAISRWIRDLLERLVGERLASRNSAIVLAWIAGFAAFAGLAVWLARFLDKPGGATRLGFARSLAPRVSAREWALRAVSALRAGDIKEAVRCAYNGALRRIEEQGTWRIDQSRTPREYLRLLSRNDARWPAVRELTDQFEQIWYGNRRIQEDDAHRVGKNLELLGCLSAAERAI